MKIGGSNEHHSALTGPTACSEAALLPRSWIRRFNITKVVGKSNVVNMKAYFLIVVFP